MLKRQFQNILSRRVTLVLCAFLIVCSCVGSVSQAQQSTAIHDDTAKAIKLFEAGDIDNAIDELRAIVEEREDDSEAWYYLGLAAKSKGNFVTAGERFGKVVSLSPNNGEAHAQLASILVMGQNVNAAGVAAKRAIELGVQNAEVHFVLGESYIETGRHAQALEEADTVLALDPAFSEVWLTIALALRGLKREQEAVEALAKYIAANPTADDMELWREDLARWRTDLQPSQGDKGKPETVVFKRDEVSTKARILSKPAPEYTEKARKLQITGTVLLSMVLSSNGNVTDVKVIQRLRGGLTTEAVKAARQTTFEPAIKDGKPVSQEIKLEYNFNIY